MEKDRMLARKLARNGWQSFDYHEQQIFDALSQVRKESFEQAKEFFKIPTQKYITSTEKTLAAFRRSDAASESLIQELETALAYFKNLVLKFEAAARDSRDISLFEELLADVEKTRQKGWFELEKPELDAGGSTIEKWPG